MPKGAATPIVATPRTATPSAMEADLRNFVASVSAPIYSLTPFYVAAAR